MLIFIAGAGAVACGTAAFLTSAGHEAVLWSPSGGRLAALASGIDAEGAVRGRMHPRLGAPDDASKADIVLIALPANGHLAAFRALAPHLTTRQVVAISSHASFGALALSRLVAARGLAVPIVAWSTTLVSGRMTAPDRVAVTTVRSRIDVATVPAGRDDALDRLRAAVGDRFLARPSLLAIELSNLNPQNHMGIALCNLTRMEKGERWDQGAHVTPAVGRLLEALDAERLAIAAALGLETRTITEHFALSFHVPPGPVSDMNAAMSAAGRGGVGPASADSRYVTEDVPYGLVPTARLGRLAGRPAPLHEAGIALFSALYGRDFAAENDLLPAAGVEGLDAVALARLALSGHRA